MKIHTTKRFIRVRIREPKLFKKGSFRTHDIGRKGYSKRIAGILKSGKWATQAILISRSEPIRKKTMLLAKARYMKKLAKRRR